MLGLPMTSDDRLTNLMFLFALAPLGTACDPGGGDTTTTSGASTGPGTTTGPGSTSTPGDTSTGPGTTTMMADSSTGPVTGSSTTDPDPTGEPINCEPKGKPPKVGEIDPACSAYNDLVNECFFDGGLPAECTELYNVYCQYYLEGAVYEYGEECGAAYAAYLDCLSQLTCKELRTGDVACADQVAAIEMACGVMQNPLRPKKITRHR